MIKSSILLAVYNKEDMVKRTLKALSCQSSQCFEIIICDDGSGPGMAGMVDEMQPLFPGRLQYVRHDDKGFRKCKILNAGAALARSDYMLVLDPDCLPHPHFVRAHLEERQKGLYLSGRRVELGEGITRSVLEGSLSLAQLSNPIGYLWQVIRFKKIRHWEAGIYVPRFLRAVKKRTPLKLKGCNMSFWKEDLERVNGFEELFQDPGGGEDTDLERRFILCGLKSKSVKHGAVCYHLHHKRLERNPKGKELYLNLKEKGSSQAVRGLFPSDRGNGK